MSHELFYELTRRRIPMTKNEGMYLKWHDTIVNIRTDKGMSFLEFSYNLKCFDRKLDLVELSIPTPKSSPGKELCTSQFIRSEMNNYDYTEMVIDSSFWPHNTLLTQEMTLITMSAWSPSNFHENRSVLAVMNNIGGVEIFMQHSFKWKSIIDLSLSIKEFLKYTKSPTSFIELKKSVYAVETSAICWAPELNSNGSCCFVTAQKNGSILFWEISACTKPLIKAEIQCNLSEICHMLWIQKTNNTFWLICADILGRIYCIGMYIEDDVIKYKQTHELWQYKDRMIASHLNYKNIKDNTLLLCTKYKHLVVQLLDNECKILSQYINNINDYRIMDMTNSLDGYYLATLNVQIFKIHFNITESKLSVDLISIPLKETYLNYELHSISFSNNNTMAVLGMIDRKLNYRKGIYKIDIIFITTETKLNSLITKILNNPRNRLTTYWDCLEVLRYKIVKSNVMPDIDYNLLYLEGSNNIYKLKVYLFLLIIYSNLRQSALLVPVPSITELSVDTVKEKILLLHAQSNLESLYKKHKDNDKLSNLEEESLYGCVKYMEYFSKKYKTDIVIDDNTYSILKTNFQYECQSCEEKVTENFTCTKGHLNIYCMLSFTPIVNDDYLVCRCCGSMSRSDLDCVPLCVFCDQLLIRVD